MSSARRNNFREALRASARSFALDSTAITRGNLNNEYGGIYVSLGIYDSAAMVFRRMLAGSPAQRADGYQSLAFLDARLGRMSSGIAHLDSAIVMDRAHDGKSEEARHRVFMAELERDRGAGVAASREIAKFMTLFHETYLEPTLLLWAGRTAARLGERRILGELLDTLAHRARKESTSDQAALADIEGEAALLDGRRREARASFALALTLEPLPHEREGAAHAAFVDNDWKIADRLYRALANDRQCCYEADELPAEAFYWVGRATEGQGDRAAAVAAYDTLLSRWNVGDSTLPTLRDARARRKALAMAMAAR